MNRLGLLLGIAIWSFSCVRVVLAEETLPDGPLIAELPQFAAWSVKCESKKKWVDPAQPPEMLSSIVVRKTNQIYQRIEEWNSGKKGEKWSIAGIQLMQPPGSSSIVPVPAPTADFPQPDYTDFAGGDFPELKWVSRERFQGLGKFAGKQAWEFRWGDRRALIDAQSRMPLMDEDANIIRTYEILPAPVSLLVPPEKFLVTLQAYKKGIKALQFHSSPP